MDTNAVLKAGVVGLGGSLLMFILLQLAISTGVAPFNIPPSHAFLIELGMDSKVLAIIVHFLYGAFWSIMLVLFYGDDVNFGRGISLSVILWVLMMIVISPIINWGFFGGGENTLIDPSNKMYVEEGAKYPLATLVIHLFYGLVIGWLNPKWAVSHIEEDEEELEE